MKTNNLKYTVNKVSEDGTQFKIDIRLNDECKNGHQDFAITGTMWEAGKRRIEKNIISCGAIGVEISKHFPEFGIFETLHLSDYLGNPMYAVENGFYHLINGFNNISVSSEEFKSKFCKYYRIDFDSFDVLEGANTQSQYATLLVNLGIPLMWKKQADEAIKLLEDLTGDIFVADSTRSNLNLSK